MKDFENESLAIANAWLDPEVVTASTVLSYCHQ